jgi:asparagine synthase (glutamine-hydrolysing)
MCGIAGLLGIDPVLAQPAARRMLEALRHRGPDDEGLAVVEQKEGRAPAVFVHTRLSIVDLSRAGHQPMADRPSNPETPPNWVTFNGEIYNYRELWADLERAGWPCRSRSDTEALLHAYRVWGVRAVERFEGMFAFALADSERGLVWICRDRVGIKPVYLYRPARGGLLFASEVRALLAVGEELVPRRLRRTAVESFLAQGAVLSDASIVEGATLLPPGESLICDLEGRLVRSTRYWSVAFGHGAGADARPADGSVPDRASHRDAEPARWRTEVVGEFAAALRESVGKLLLADVPVGLFLSSGIDSTALAATAMRHDKNGLRTLAVGFDVPEFDESFEAAETARGMGVAHERVVLSGNEILDSFDDVLGAMDQPTVDGFNTYYVSRAARRAGLTVALSGVGGDELFGGYASFSDVPRALLLSELGTRPGVRGAGAMLKGALSLASGARPLRAHARALQKAAAVLSCPSDLVTLYFLRRELFARAERRALHPLPPSSDPHSGIEVDVLDALRSSHADRDPLDRIAFLEFTSYMRHMLLRDSDVFGMANQLEIRVPLLEHYAVAQAARARSAWRQSDPRPKPLLIDAAGPLPERVWRRKKRGFTFPWGAWLAGPLKGSVAQALASEAFEAARIDQKAVVATHRAFAAGDTRVSPLQVLALVVLGAYVRRHGLAA